MMLMLLMLHFFIIFSLSFPLSNAFSPQSGKCGQQLFRTYRNKQVNALQPANKELDSSNKMNLIPPWFPAFSTACLGGLMFGLDIGSSSSVVRILGEGGTDLGNLNSFQLGEIASGSLFGAIISSFLIIITGDKFVGRKLELQIASIMFLVGTIIQSSSTDFAPELIGRLIYGLGIGTAMHVAPLFIAETSPNDLRGKLISFKEAAIVAGIVAGYGFGAFFGESGNWHGVFQSAVPFELLMFAGACSVPESPRWLALGGKTQEAEESLMKLQNLSIEESRKSVAEMIQLSKKTESSSSAPAIVGSENPPSKVNEILQSKYNRRALVIGLGLVLFQQLSGQPSVLYFANRIFERAGLGFQAAVFVGIFKLIMTSISAYLVESPKFGRKSLLLYGNVGVTISLMLLSFLYSQQSAASGEDLQSQLGIIASMFLFVGSYQVGFGPITWLVLSEIFPLRVRSAAVSLGTLTNFASNLVVTLLFETERAAFGESLLFLQFGLIGLASVLFTYTYVIETQGLSLEEIERKLTEEVDKAGS
jgi:sugar porter (SP) family MFS transporter